jgi:hypothetical protein
MHIGPELRCSTNGLVGGGFVNNQTLYSTHYRAAYLAMNQGYTRHGMEQSSTIRSGPKLPKLKLWRSSQRGLKCLLTRNVIRVNYCKGLSLPVSLPSGYTT